MANIIASGKLRLVPISQVPEHDRVAGDEVTLTGRQYIMFHTLEGEIEQGWRPTINKVKVKVKFVIEIGDGVAIVHEALPQGRRDPPPPPPPPLPQEPEAPALPEVVEIEGDILEELSADVFGNDMLRETILKYLIYTNGGVSGSDLKNLRLVRKDWLGTIAELMRRIGDPMFTLIFNNGPEKKLDQFVSAMVSPSRLPDFIPPFSLKLLPEFFHSENYRNLSDCLLSCGMAMTDLELLFPLNSTMALVLPPFHLPKLGRLAVQFSDHRLSDQSAMNLNNDVTIHALQSILNATNQLKELAFKFTSSESLIPCGFEYVILPETVTKLQLDCPLKDSDLNLLISNDLPRLTSLRLFVANKPYPGDLIFRIMEKFQATLLTLCLGGVPYIRQGQNYTLFKFPLMENLEALTVSTPCWEFEVGDRQHLERQFPKMSELSILNTDNATFTTWTENSKYKGVKSLGVSLWDNGIPVTITLEKMQSLHLAYPNVVNLSISLYGLPSCGVKFLFMEMRSLEKLEITVKESSGQHFLPNHWDSLLIGITQKVVARLRRNPYWMNFTEFRDNNNFPSIRNLIALKSFSLDDKSEAFELGESEPLISDLVFYLAFRQMPKLTELSLFGRFLPSPQFSERWKQEKGTEIVRD